jgi:DNA-binding response OmpR family regulator
MRILVAEDERFLADMVADGLRRAAMAVDVALDGREALAKLYVNDYDVVVLDRDLPAVHGDDVCREIVRRQASERLLSRVLMLTAADTVEDRIAGLGLGADDYLAKPFSYGELVARVLALGRRSRPAVPPVIERAGIVMDTARRQASRDGRFLSLSRKEFAVLEVLMRADGRVLGDPPVIETLPGAGYRLAP